MSNNLNEISVTSSPSIKDEEIVVSKDDNLSAKSPSPNKLAERKLDGDSSTTTTHKPINRSEDSGIDLTSISSSLQKFTSSTSAMNSQTSRNLITGSGLGADEVKFRRNGTRRDGNPLTGEGYEVAGADIKTKTPSLNGVNEVINKNRVPPGGFSSGLW